MPAVLAYLGSSLVMLASVVWVFVVATVLDLANTMRGGVQEAWLGKATDVSWMILNSYVPLLRVSLGLIVWRLLMSSPLDALPPQSSTM